VFYLFIFVIQVLLPFGCVLEHVLCKVVNVRCDICFHDRWYFSTETISFTFKSQTK